MDDELRVALWNAYYLAVIERSKPQYGYGVTETFSDYYHRLWANHLKRPLDSMPKEHHYLADEAKKYFKSCEWYGVYDLIEFTTQNLRTSLREDFERRVNSILERELSGYRSVSGKIVAISDKSEVESIESALNSPETPRSVRVHLNQALQMLSSRTSPDYRNSIKESISAVESLAKSMTGDPHANLGAALQIIESQGKMHAALKKSLTALYGYTSDEGGIRHALLDESTSTFADAKFMLVVCTAFVNYMTAKLAGV